jgi:glycosyltransferase involved in cell wall biosynthesis
VGDGEVVLSVVVPAYNEAQFLPRLLVSIGEARRALGDANAVEVIVADNASTDATAQIAARAGCKVVRVERRAIAAARNGGAAAASAAVLCFVDADCRVDAGIFRAVLAALEDPRVGMGASGIRFERTSAGIAVTVGLFMPIVRIMGIDGGLVFMRRDDFEAVGRYDESLLVAEDVDLLLKVRKRCRARGQRFIRLEDVPTIASARKFDRHGEWHFLRTAFAMAWNRAFRPARFDAAARRYWYEDR